MKKLNILLLLLILIFSCTTRHESKPISTGRNAEVLVLTTNKIWNSVVADSLRAVFSKAQIGLNQPEPMFRLLQVDKLSDLLSKHRNILHIIIHDSVQKPIVEYSVNPFAAPQIYIEIRANSEQSFYERLNYSKQVLFDKYRETDYKRIQKAYKSQENKQLQKQIEKKFNCSLTIPQSFWLAKQSTDFAWLRLETAKHSQAILIYQQDFVDSASLNLDYLIKFRNTVTQLHIPGSIDGSYMTTDTIIQPVMRYAPFMDTKIIEIRGLWRTIGDFMGGPFVSYAFVDKHRNKLLILEGYVYYPNKEKRDLLLQLEAIIHSLKFTN